MKKVLIIEDDDFITKLYRLRLERESLGVVVATHGDEGLEMIKSEKPDLVMLDVMLPGKDGFWVLEEMKKDTELSKVPVIVLSNLSQDKDKMRALGLGATGYIVKAELPIQGVIDRIKAHLDGGKTS